MVYFLQRNFPPSKTLWVVFTQFYGLGNHQAYQICSQLGVSIHKKVGHLTSRDFEKLTEILTQNYEIQTEIQRKTFQNIQRLVKIASYRGFRHSECLPVRGQRTHGNARTARKFQRVQSFGKKN